MLTSVQQRPHKPAASVAFSDAEFAALDPSAKNAATQVWLDTAQGLKLGTTKNRDWRETIGQGPSFELFSSVAGNDADPDDFDPRDTDPEPDTHRRVGEGEGEETSDVCDTAAADETDGQITIDTDPVGGLGFATANPFNTHTPRARGGLARSLDKNAWNAILALTPIDDPNRLVIVASAQCGAGESKQIGMMVGLGGRRVRGVQDQSLKNAFENFTAADLRAHRDDPITTEIVTRRPPSRAGRKPKATAAIPRVLVLVPKVAGPKRPYNPRPRLRYVDPGQLDFFDCFEEAA